MVFNSFCFIIVFSFEQNLLADVDDDDDDYFAEFIYPDESDDESECFYSNNNDDIFLQNHLNCKQLCIVDHYEEETYERSKRSNKKMHAARQIKTKHAKSIKIKSHNKQLYMHHRLFKKVKLDPPSQHYMSSNFTNRSYKKQDSEPLSTERRNPRNVSNKENCTQQPATQNNDNHFHAYTINENTIPNETHFDDEMITLLLDMQNRDL